ncbi:MAG: hypothetical protein LBC76_02650 [Treponema sp.]|nr:hypothetical protein [Treponema sp.]
MQAIMESAFSVIYLITVITIGCYIIRRQRQNRQYMLFGIMTLILGFGDAFHLIPRIIALWTTGLENYTVALGFGKLITSITMTLFYVILYHVWRIRYNVEGKNKLTVFVYALAVIRIVLCLFPQNRWLNADAPFSWGIYRNIPFVFLGLIIIIIFFRMAKKNNDQKFKLLWLAVLISFSFYIPVVLWADVYPLIGMLMLPKTCAYVWLIWMGFNEIRLI